MSAYDDAKRAIQEFLAPELAALRERVEQNERRAQERHETLLREITWRFDSLKDALELRKRIDELERRAQGKAAEERQVS